MGKDGYRRKCFFDETIHYDKDGKKISESRPNFFGVVSIILTCPGRKQGTVGKVFWAA